MSGRPYVHDMTASEAQQRYFPELTVYELEAFHISYTQSADWHAEMTTDAIWLPMNDQFRQIALNKFYPRASNTIYAQERLTDG